MVLGERRGVWEFVKEAAPGWSHEYHVPVSVGAAVVLLVFAAGAAWMVRRATRKRFYARYRTSKW